MITLTALALFAQIQVSSNAIEKGRKLQGGTFRAEVAARQKTIPPAEWEKHKHVRYLGTIDYALRSESAAPKKPASTTAKAPPQTRRGKRR